MQTFGKLQSRLIALFLLLVAVPAVHAADGTPMPAAAPGASAHPGPREPLSFRDSGAYGGWNDYWLSPECPFNYLIVQAIVLDDGRAFSHGQNELKSWNDWLEQARRKGKRVIAVITPDGSSSAKDPVARFRAALDDFMKNVDESQLYCITLGEENIYWNGREQMLKDLYAYSKSRYGVPVYQWYSPYAGQPGFGWPHLPADGWITDEYVRGGPSFEHFLRAYTVHQLPVIHIVWAAPLMTDFDWREKGDPAFDWQIAVCRKYNVPVSYFMWEGRGNTWGWSKEALPISKAVFARAAEWSQRAASTDLQPYAATWDDIPSLLPGKFVNTPDKRAVFREDFLAGAGSIHRGAVISGFRDIRWDGGPLELRPREAGPATAVLQYPLTSVLPLQDVRVQVSGSVDLDRGGEVSVSTSTDGRSWSAETALSTTGTATVEVAGPGKTLDALWVRVFMRGTARAAGEVPATLKTLEVTGRLDVPGKREIVLQAAPSKKMFWEADLDSATPFLAEIDNPAELEVSESGIATHATAGRPNVVTVRQKFVCDAGLDIGRIAMVHDADEVNHAATNSLGISLDGVNVLEAVRSKGKAQGEELALSLGEDARFKNLKQFWIHIGMSNASGLKSGTTNRISHLSIESTGAAPAAP